MRFWQVYAWIMLVMIVILTFMAGQKTPDQHVIIHFAGACLIVFYLALPLLALQALVFVAFSVFRK